MKYFNSIIVFDEGVEYLLLMRVCLELEFRDTNKIGSTNA